MRVTFHVPGEVVPWARAGRTRQGFAFTPKRQKDYQAVVRSLAHEAMDGRPPIEGPCALKVVAFYPWPKGATLKRRHDPAGAWKATRPDVDNLIKLVSDTLQGIAFRDDGQLARMVAEKVHGPAAGLTVMVRTLADVPCPHARPGPPAPIQPDMLNLTGAA